MFNGISDDSFRWTGGNSQNNLCYTDHTVGRSPQMCVFKERDSDNIVCYATKQELIDTGLSFTIEQLNIAEARGGEPLGSLGVASPGDAPWSIALDKAQNPGSVESDLPNNVFTAAGGCSDCKAGGAISLDIHETLGQGHRIVNLALDAENTANTANLSIVDSSFSSAGGEMVLSNIRTQYLAVTNNNTTASAFNAVKIDSIEHKSWLTQGEGNNVPAIGDTTYNQLSSEASKQKAFSHLLQHHSIASVGNDDTNTLKGALVSPDPSSELYADHSSVNINGTDYQAVSSSQGATNRQSALMNVNVQGSAMPLINSSSRIAQRTVIKGISAAQESDGQNPPAPKFLKIKDQVDLLTVITLPDYAFTINVVSEANGHQLTDLSRNGQYLTTVKADLGRLTSQSLGFTGDDPLKVIIEIQNASIGNLHLGPKVGGFELVYRADKSGNFGSTNLIADKSDFITKLPYEESKGNNYEDSDQQGARINQGHLYDGQLPVMEVQLPAFARGKLKEHPMNPGFYKFTAAFNIFNDINIKHDLGDQSGYNVETVQVNGKDHELKYEVTFEVPSAFYDSDIETTQPARRRRRRRR